MAELDLDELVDSSGYGILDTVLHYGLFLGAIFQLICILAVIFVPSKPEEMEEEVEDGDVPKIEQHRGAGDTAGGRSRRHEKKKKK